MKISSGSVFFAAATTSTIVFVTASPGRQRIRSPIASQTVAGAEIGERAAATSTSAPSTTAAPSSTFTLGTDVCGWVAGSPLTPWQCLAPGTCIIDQAVSAVGCCTSSSCGLFRTACIPFTQACDTACRSNSANLICDVSTPLCATYSYPNSVSEVRCVTQTPDAAHVSIEYTYTGFTDPLALPRLLTGISGTTAPGSYKGLKIQTQIPLASTSTSPAKKTTTSPQTDSDTSSSNTSPTSSSSSSSTAAAKSSSSTGAIVGGVIGGLAVLGCLAGAGYFFWRRRSQNRSQVAANGQVSSETGWQHIPFKKNGYSPVVRADATEMAGWTQRSEENLPTELDGGGDWDPNPFSHPADHMHGTGTGDASASASANQQAPFNRVTRQPTERMELEG